MARLLVLWLLNERAMHGYQIKKALTDDGMAFWFRLEDASIYSVLRTLTKNGYAESDGGDSGGGRRQRTTYRITSSGRQYYRSLLAEALATPVRPASPIDVALSARGDLEPTEVSSALADRSKRLHELVAEMQRGKRAAPSAAMVERNLAVVQAELDWLDRLDHSSVS